MQASRAVERPLSNTRAAWVAILLAVGACKVGAEDIEYWKGTVKGPGKIVSVMLADKYPMELRTQAALALVDMERTDRDGTNDLQQGLTRLDDAERNTIISGMVPGLEGLMKQVDASASGSASPRQIRAKDAAFVLITHAPPDVKQKLTDDVIAWYMEDFNGRSLAGNYSAEQVVRALGPAAGKELLKGMKARMPAAALVKMVQLVGQIADANTKKDAGNKLIAIFDEMEGKEFLAWVKQSVKEQAERQQAKLDAKALDKAAETNRDNFLNEGAIPAMKFLADVPAVKKRLLSIAATPVAGDVGTTRRTHALMALEGKVDNTDLDAILKLALNKDNPTTVRDYAFDRVGDIRSPDALPELQKLVASNEDPRLRWRAGELYLAIGGGAVVPDFFKLLPAGGEYPPEELEGYATRLGQISPAPVEQLKTQLASASWYAKVIAVRYFERKGGAEDIKRIEKLSSDPAATKGPRWGSKLKTVGDVASEAVADAKTRLADPGAK